MRPVPAIGIVVFLSALIPSPVWAAGRGYRFFTEGLGHPLAVPAHLLVLIALGILLAQPVWQQAVLKRLGVLVSGSLMLVLALESTLWHQWRPAFELMLLGLALVMGMLAVLRLGLPDGLLQLLALLTLATIGLDSAAPRLPGLRGATVQFYLLGVWCSVMLIWLAALLPSLLLRRLLDGLPLRILGAWVTAAAMMVMALQLVNLFRT
ncbi:MAG: hypothetical protein KDI15_06575 [Thiothrix sp.]|nr:hypothetical protein [Thiothrix sp.]HPE60243.1 hypothetical protein [Thiolinea sp.]